MKSKFTKNIPEMKGVTWVVNNWPDDLVLVSIDPNAGRENVFTVLRIFYKTGQTRVIGRELPWEMALEASTRPANKDGTRLEQYIENHPEYALTTKWVLQHKDTKAYWSDKCYGVSDNVEDANKWETEEEALKYKKEYCVPNLLKHYNAVSIYEARYTPVVETAKKPRKKARFYVLQSLTNRNYYIYKGAQSQCRTTFNASKWSKRKLCESFMKSRGLSGMYKVKAIY